MSTGMDIRYFAHSWVSDWNHGNAHFLRGLARELGRLGHKVRCYEALGSWSLTNLLRHEGERAKHPHEGFGPTAFVKVRYANRGEPQPGRNGASAERTDAFLWLSTALSVPR